MVSILDNKTIAELVVKNGDDYQKINPETLATIVEDVTGTTTETEKTVQEHIDNKSIHLTAEDVEDLTKDNLKSEDIVAGANITVTTDPDTNKVTISTTDHPVEDFLTKEDIKATDDSITVTPSETDNTVSLKVNFPDSSKYLVQQNIKPGNQNITVEYSPDSNNVLISASNNIYTAGDGIAISRDNIVTNTKPDQIISLNPGKNIAITGDYPNFTIIGTNDATLVDWTPNTEYSQGTVVIYENALFECIEDHTSDVGFDESKWKILAGFSAAREFFYNATEETTSITLTDEIPNKEVVIINAGGILQQSQNYDLEPDHKTITFIKPIPAGVIIEVLSMGNMVLHTYDERANIIQWQEGLSFAKGNVCIYNNAMYICLEDNIASEPFDKTKWQLISGYSKVSYFFDVDTETNTITLPLAVDNKESIMVNIGNTLIQSDNYEIDDTGKIITFTDNVEAGARIEVTIFGSMILLNPELPRPYQHSLEYLRVKQDESEYELITKDVVKEDLNIKTLTDFTNKAGYFPQVNENETDFKLVDAKLIAGEVQLRNTQNGFTSEIIYGTIPDTYPEHPYEADDTLVIQPGSIMDSTGTVLLKINSIIIKNPNKKFKVGNNNGSSLKDEQETWIQPVMTSNTQPLGKVITSSAQTDREGYRAMDGLKQTGNGWLTDVTSATWYYTAIYPLRVTAIDFYNQGSGLENRSKDIDIWVAEPSNVVASFTALNEDYGHSHVEIPTPQIDKTIGLTIKNSYGNAVGANEIDIMATFSTTMKKNTKFNVFVISNDTGDIVDIGTESGEIPTLPDGYTRYAKIGSFTSNNTWHLYNNYPTQDLNTIAQSGGFTGTLFENKIESWIQDENKFATKIIEQWGVSTPVNGKVSFPESYKNKLLYVMANGIKILSYDNDGFTVDTSISEEINWVAKGY